MIIVGSLMFFIEGLRLMKMYSLKNMIKNDLYYQMKPDEAALFYSLVNIPGLFRPLMGLIVDA